MAIDQEKLELDVLRFGKDIFADAQQRSSSIFNLENITGKLLNIAMGDEAMKVAFFRFVDVLPQLTSTRQVIQHVQEYFAPFTTGAPDLLVRILTHNPDSLTAKVAAATITKQVRFVAERFIVGETPEKALGALKKIRKRGMAFTVDLLGEATVSDEESLVYLERYLSLLDVLGREVPSWTEATSLSPGHIGEQTPINISVKLSALYSQSYPLNHELAVEILSTRLAQIFERAQAIGAFCYVDMEDTALTDITLSALKHTLLRPELRNFNRAGIVLQAYLRRTHADATALISWARQQQRQIGVRLVKGAYWDTETIFSKQAGWPVPVWQRKESSDYWYERIADLLLENTDAVTPAFGSHNIRSLCYAIKAAEVRKIPATHFELQTLYGMGESVKQAFQSRGYLVREYAPIGELIPGMGYLVRRLLENTSNEGFLNLSFNAKINPNTLLRRPQFDPSDTDSAYFAKRSRHAFYNCPFIDFSLVSERSAMLSSLSEFNRHHTNAKRKVHPIVSGKEIPGNETLESRSPEKPSDHLATVTLADAALAESTVERLNRYLPIWSSTSFSERAQLLERVAAHLEKTRFALTATIIREVGKPWKEADADVAEAIDFLRYYALHARDMDTPLALGDYPGEDNRYWYQPRGVTVVISPWNFPIAIACGMFAASLVCGNTTILKPAEQSSIIAEELFKAFLSCGMPPEAAAFLPGIGEEIGPVLVHHPLVSTIAFTGSKSVGLSILKTAGEVTPGSVHVKRVVAEMGGKNAIVVDEDADLDEAVKGVVYSAFGFQGQKCSACSRVYVVGKPFDAFLSRLARATESLLIGPASHPGTFVGPVIDSEAQQRLLATIEQATKDHSLVTKGNNYLPHDTAGYFVPPTVFTGVSNSAPFARDEHFGPLLMVEQVASFEAGIASAIDSEYALTGAVFSRSPKNIAYAAREFQVGNLYINRSSTGALVMRHPFGGAKMSGVGSKAGGPDYLKQFVIPRSISENTVRRGFAPNSSQ